jgi:hypothetical protein
MHNHLISPQEIRKWAHEIAYQLDQPGVLVLDEITSTVRNWEEEPYKSDLKFCLASPVTYESVVSNLGMAILYNEINDNGVHPSTTGVLCERCYFPEKKLLSRLEKKGYPLFSKENFVPIKNFDVFGISSYYPLQFLNFPRMFEMSDIPVWSRTESQTILQSFSEVEFRSTIRSQCQTSLIASLLEKEKRSCYMFSILLRNVKMRMVM